MSSIDGIEVRLRRLADSSEPAVVFASLVRLCVPWYCDTCSVDIVEAGRVRYRVNHPQRGDGPITPLRYADRSVVIAFGSDLPGWAGYTGVLTSSWHTRRPTALDEVRAAAIVEHAVDTISRERRADPVRSALAFSAAADDRRTQLRSC